MPEPTVKKKPRSRTKSGKWRKKRSDVGKPRKGVKRVLPKCSERKTPRQLIPNVTSVIGVRLPPEDKQLLQKVCEARGQDISDFVRHAIYVKLALLGLLDKERTDILLASGRKKTS